MTEKKLLGGAVYDTEAKKIVRHEGGEFQFNSQTAAAAARKRWADQREAFAKGFVEGVPSGAKGNAEAWQAVGSHVASVLFGTRQARGLAELLGKAGELSGFAPGKLELEEVTPPGGFYLTPEQLLELGRVIAYINRLERGEVVEGHAEPISNDAERA